jgi:hypothetical protein
MHEFIHRGLYHFWSSGLAVLLGLVSIYLTSSRSRSEDRDGSISWMSSRQFYLLLLLAVWVHIPADVIEHGGPPKIISGIQGLIEFVVALL